jgi:hypothetical protein
LNSLNVPLRQYPIQIKERKRKTKVDGYDPETNTVYQFHGDYYHGNPDVYSCPITWNQKVKKFMYELYDRTLKSDELIKKSGYNLVTIWEKDYK